VSQDFAVVGLGVMGENLALNVERNGFSVAVYNRNGEKTDEFLEGRAAGKKFVGAKTLAELAKNVSRPRRILLMVKAGGPVDAVVAEIKPFLEPGDVVIDGGNSHYPDTDRRIAALEPTGIRFFGMGVSGGEEGALWGPSLMPGGDRKLYDHLEPILTKIAAKADSGPCVTYCGARSAGHFVKMVHNGIEYGDMQLIAEAYDLLRHGVGLGAAELADTFAEWNAGDLQSFLIEITAKIVAKKDDQGSRKVLLDQILDKAGQKGTGKWTGEAALDFGVPIPTIAAAVDARILSSAKHVRVEASKLYKAKVKPVRSGKKKLVKAIREALYASKICSYAQGFELLRRASSELQYGIDLSETARIWKGGCIIRAVFLDKIREAFDKKPDLANLLLDDGFRKEIKKRVEGWEKAVGTSIQLGITAPAMAASLAYFHTFRRARGPAYLIQAQRDFFGAHTYERVDREGSFHTDWSKS
jgi:6-phosphogluconate dehydrogenase